MSEPEGDEVQLDYVETPTGLRVPTFESVQKAFERLREWFEKVEQYLNEDDRRIVELQREVGELKTSAWGSGAAAGGDEELREQLLRAIEEIRRRLDRIEDELTEVSEATQLLFEIAERLELSEKTG